MIPYKYLFQRFHCLDVLTKAPFCPKNLELILPLRVMAKHVLPWFLKTKFQLADGATERGVSYWCRNLEQN